MSGKEIIESLGSVVGTETRHYQRYLINTSIIGMLISTISANLHGNLSVSGLAIEINDTDLKNVVFWIIWFCLGNFVVRVFFDLYICIIKYKKLPVTYGVGDAPTIKELREANLIKILQSKYRVGVYLIVIIDNIFPVVLAIIAILLLRK